MPRTTIAAVLAFLLLLAPTASARPADLGYPSYPTPKAAAQPNVMPERITDHPAPAGDTAAALAQERYYASYGGRGHAALIREQESTSGSGNQGVPPADDGTPWAIVALGIAGAALAAGGLTIIARRTRTRARVAA